MLFGVFSFFTIGRYSTHKKFALLVKVRGLPGVVNHTLLYMRSWPQIASLFPSGHPVGFPQDGIFWTLQL